jgi:hypothetical protein
MKPCSAFSTKIDAKEAVADIHGKLGDVEAVLIVFFASPAYEPAVLAAAMAAQFPAAVTFGCTTAGEIVTGKMLSRSVVAMAFDRTVIKSVKVEVLEDLNQPSYAAFASLEQHFNRPIAEMEPDRYVGLLLADGLSRKEEQIMDRIGDLSEISFIGGSAGDDLRFSVTHVYANGNSYPNSALVALLEPAVPFSILKTQSFTALPEKLVVTRANEAEREVLEFNSKPAATAYAEALGVSVEELPDRFMQNPLGLVFDDEPFVRSPQSIKNGAVVFYCAIKESMELQVLESTDIIQDTRRDLANAVRENGELSAIINFNCILRTLELVQKGLTEEYGELFSIAPTIGFSTYGEQYIGHINQTATMLLLHKNRN